MLDSPRLSPTPERGSMAERYAVTADAAQAQVGALISDSSVAAQTITAGAVVTGRFLGSIPVSGAHLLGRMQQVSHRGIWVALATGVMDSLNGLADLEMDVLRLADAHWRGESLGDTSYDRVCANGNVLLPAMAALWGLTQFTTPSNMGRMPMNQPAFALATEVAFPTLPLEAANGILMMAAKPPQRYPGHFVKNILIDTILDTCEKPEVLIVKMKSNVWRNAVPELAKLHPQIFSATHIFGLLEAAKVGCYYAGVALESLLPRIRAEFQQLYIRAKIYTCDREIPDLELTDWNKTSQVRPYVADMAAAIRHHYNHVLARLLERILRIHQQDGLTPAEIDTFLDAARGSDAIRNILVDTSCVKPKYITSQHIPALLLLAKDSDVIAPLVFKLVQEHWEVIAPHWPEIEKFLADYSREHNYLRRSYEAHPELVPTPVEVATPTPLRTSEPPFAWGEDSIPTLPPKPEPIVIERPIPVIVPKPEPLLKSIDVAALQKTLDQRVKPIQGSGVRLISKSKLITEISHAWGVDRGTIEKALTGVRMYGDIEVVDQNTIRLSSAAHNFRKDVYQLTRSVVTNIHPETGTRTETVTVVREPVGNLMHVTTRPQRL